MKTHSWIKVKRCPWNICGSCGLIGLKNAVSNKASSVECRGYFREHVWVGG